MTRTARIWLQIGGLALLASGCSQEQRSTSLTPVDVISPCQFSTSTAGSPHRVTMRGYLSLHAHGLNLVDPVCPSVMIILETTPKGPDLNLCDLPEMVEKYGCPTGNDGTVVTVGGTLRNVKESSALLVVDEFLSIQKVPLANGA